MPRASNVYVVTFNHSHVKKNVVSAFTVKYELLDYLERLDYPELYTVTRVPDGTKSGKRIPFSAVEFLQKNDRGK
jgi:hypothetical protein